MLEIFENMKDAIDEFFAEADKFIEKYSEK